MSDKQTPSALGGEFGKLVDKANDYMKTVDPHLNQIIDEVKKDLDNFNKTANPNVSKIILDAAKRGFMKDLEELGIKGEKADEYIKEFDRIWAQESMAIKTEKINSSSELAAIEGFIGKLETFSKLNEAINSTEPQTKLQMLFGGAMKKMGIPMDDTMKKYLKQLLPEWAVGFLIPEKKKDGPEAAIATADPTLGKGDKGGDKGKDDSEKGGDKKAKTGKEAREVSKVGSTLILGDSINASLAQAKNSGPEVTGRKETIAEASKSSSWLLEQLQGKPDNYFKGFKNAVILIGTNDLGGSESAEIIWGRIEACYKILQKHKIKIYGVTLPPGKGNAVGKWKTDFKSVEATRIAVNEKIRTSSLVNHVIDLALTEEKGGLADNKDTEMMSKNLRLNAIHPKPDALTAIYQKALEEGSTK